jgi:hypothetical protein
VSIVAYTPAEVIKISKEDLEILPQVVINRLKSEIRQYPPDRKLRRTYLEGI